MIQQNELRVGNWVAHPVGKDVFLKVAGQDLGNPKVLNTINPIPLTPEILEKCGFEIDQDLTSPLTDVYFIYLKMGSVFVGLYKGHYSFYFGKYADYPVTISSLHQLQNLYFALTGNELNYTP